ncbi:MAG: response regulator [Mariprofundaceae bacterium]
MNQAVAQVDVLVVEDEAPIARLMEIHLQRAGYTVQCCGDGSEALELLAANDYKLLVLDRMLPGMRGLDLLRWLRKQDRMVELPVLMVTALGLTEERVRGLNEGADDYLPKPFEPSELIARIQALLRRSKHVNALSESKPSKIEMDSDAQEAFVRGEKVGLRPLEFRLLKRLMKKPGKVRSREYLLDHVWGVNSFVEERTVDVTVKRLRKALDEHGLGDCVVTVRGAGYRFVEMA